MGITYKKAGVDIDAGDETIRRIKGLVRSTFNERVLSDLGLFGGFFDAKFSEYNHPVLVSSTDGVGTKLKIAFLMNKHDTVGQCLVNHCVNDILTSGAKPLFFLDYFATGKLYPEVAFQVVSGFVEACRNNECVLIGGETAEMPSFYSDSEYDISGTIVGIVEKDKIINGKKIQRGDVLIGLKSNGLHTNGYSLARAVLLEKFSLDDYFPELNSTLGEELLRVHKSYLKVATPLLQEGIIDGVSHITGGGIIGNSIRILPEGLGLKIDWNAWEIPFIFELIQREGNISDDEMRRVFNLGIGLVLFTKPEFADKVVEKLKGEEYFFIGEVV